MAVDAARTSDPGPEAGAGAEAATREGRSGRLAAIAIVAVGIAGCVLSIAYGAATLAASLPKILAALPDAPYALDGGRMLDAAAILAAGGDPVSAAGNLYSPLAAWFMEPFLVAGHDAGVWFWAAVKTLILVWCVLDATRGERPGVRVVGLALVATLVFVLDDLILGNVSILIAASMYLAVSRDRAWAGIPFGIALAVMAKPLVLPFLAWLVVYRRAGAITAVATAFGATVVGIVVLGWPLYRSYLDALVAASRLDFTWSLGLAGVAPDLLLPASIAAYVVLALLLWRSRDPSSVLVWSLLVGLIAAPYVGHYSVIPVLAGIPAFARAHPTRLLLLAGVALPLSLVALMPATVVAMVIAFPGDVLRRTVKVEPTRAPGSGTEPVAMT
jgi:hypothetical protein